MAGKEAIADTSLPSPRPPGRAERSIAARPKRAAPACFLSALRINRWTLGIWLLLAVGPAAEMLSPQSGGAGSAAIAAEPSPPIQVSGDVVYRWQIDNAQASLLEGDCVLIHDGRRIRASRILVVSDGPRGRVRNRLVIEGRIQSDGSTEATPRTVVWTTSDDPEVQAPQFRGRPSDRPFLMQYLPSTSIEAVGGVSHAGGRADVRPGVSPAVSTPPVTDTFAARGGSRSESGSVEQVQFPQPVPDGGVNEPQIPTPSITPPLAPPATDFTPTDQLPPPVPSGPIELPPATGLPLADDPPPPLVFEDGATTGGQQFFYGGGSKSVEFDERDTTRPPDLRAIDRPETNETIIIARGGVTLRIRDVAARMSDGQLMQFGTVTVSADRVVGWLPLLRNVFDGGAELTDAEGELYLEGDIVFRQGDNVIYADAMYYNVTQETGMVLDAEAITTVPEYQGVVRLKAEVLQQVSRGNYRAFDAAVTSSRLGVPRYWLQSEELQFYEKTRNLIDPRTGMLVADKDPFVKSSNSFVYVGGLPVFWWPTFSTSLERPTFYLSDLKIGNDSNYGTQVMLDWDIFQLLGKEDVPEGVSWDLSTDYLSKRGPALGTHLTYDLPGFLGHPGRTRGLLDVWGIYDTGTDRLGMDRLALVPETEYRGRALFRHRQQWRRDYEFIAELGYISDRNFMEQYLESEWDRDPDRRTGLLLRHYRDNRMLEFAANARVNPFFKETERLPELNHYMLGGTLFGEHLTWQMHNHVSYSRLKPADDPTDPAEAAINFPLPGEEAHAGVIASTRQELSIKLPLGPTLLRPIASFEAAHYGEATNGEPLTRLLGQGGLQFSLPMVRVDPTIESSLLNMRGLAHKVDWVAEYWYADSSANQEEVPYYDELDDNAQEQARRRFIGYTFGGVLPPEFDPRSYAFRQGIQRRVTSPSDVVADDLQQLRLGVHQRFQTKRGLPGRERIVDVVQFDLDTILFPEGDRDNFGETVGPTTYDFRYHLGDRYSILSDGYFDFFDSGLQSLSAGIRTSRPGVSDAYIGILAIEGPVSSTVLRTNYDFRLNEKWIFSGGTAYDFGRTGNIGQYYGLTRIGESMLVRLNLNVDSGRDNVGFGFLIEPRFFARNLGRIGGGLIPPPGIEGLE